MKFIEIGFTLLGRKKELAIFMFIGFAINSINGSIVHTALRVNNQVRENN